MRLLPDRLPAISARAARIVGPVWYLALAVAIAAQLCGAAFVLYNAYRTNPAYIAFGLSSAIDYEGGITVSPVGRESERQHIVEDSRILAIDGQPVAAHATAEAIARQLRTVRGPEIGIRLRAPDGTISDHRLTRSAAHRREATARNALPLDLRMAVRFLFAGLSSAALLGSAIVLFRLRRNDTEAVIMSFAFIGMAAVVDPPMLMWMGLNLSWVIDVGTGLWWTAIVIALAGFPDGRFSPGWLRWIVPIAPLLGLFLALDLGSTLVSLGCGVLPPLVVIGAQAVRYRRLPVGIERQQLKWAAFGFFAGFVLLGLSLLLAEYSDDPSWSPTARAGFYLAVVCLFNLAFAVMPLGLLVSLSWFRLWEVDAVISRSAAFTAVTLVVGLTWAAGSEIVKLMLGSFLGAGHTGMATAIGAVLAAGVFAPTQALVFSWSKRRLNRNLTRLIELPQRLRTWRETEPAPEVGMRTLAVIVDSVHAEGAALTVLTPTGRELVAAHNVADPQALARSGSSPWAGEPNAVTLQLDDGVGPIGTLLIAPRTDHNRYSRAEREALEGVVTPLAEALRTLKNRALRESGIEKMFSKFEARLAKLEGPGQPEPA